MLRLRFGENEFQTGAGRMNKIYTAFDFSSNIATVRPIIRRQNSIRMSFLVDGNPAESKVKAVIVFDEVVHMF